MSCLGGRLWPSDSDGSDDERASSPSARPRIEDEEDKEWGIESANPARLQAALFLNPDTSLGFSFSGGGFLLPYHIGCIKALRRLSLVRPGITQVGGTSAGSLAAVILALGLDEDKVLASVRDMMADFREHGVYKRLGPGVRETVRPCWLHSYEDCTGLYALDC